MTKATEAANDLKSNLKGSSDRLTGGFIAFLKEYGIIGLAIAVIIGAAVGKLVGSFVGDIVMPIVTFFIPGGNWREATLALGPIVLKLGSFIGNIIDFVIIALVVYLMAKWILKEEKVTKK
jgi:large conductance mechanosensitive channel